MCILIDDDHVGTFNDVKAAFESMADIQEKIAVEIVEAAIDLESLKSAPFKQLSQTQPR